VTPFVVNVPYLLLSRRGLESSQLQVKHDGLHSSILSQPFLFLFSFLLLFNVFVFVSFLKGKKAKTETKGKMKTKTEITKTK